MNGVDRLVEQKCVGIDIFSSDEIPVFKVQLHKLGGITFIFSFKLQCLTQTDVESKQDPTALFKTM